MRGRQWTPEEDERLIRLRKAGMSWAVVGAQLGRSARACQAYAAKAGYLSLNGPLAETYGRKPQMVPRRMAPVPQTTTPTGLTRGSVPPTRLHLDEWRDLRTEPVTRDEWRQRIVEGARRRREATA